jgi:hypothetical protein
MISLKTTEVSARDPAAARNTSNAINCVVRLMTCNEFSWAGAQPFDLPHGIKVQVAFPVSRSALVWP